MFRAKFAWVALALLSYWAAQQNAQNASVSLASEDEPLFNPAPSLDGPTLNVDAHYDLPSSELALIGGYLQSAGDKFNKVFRPSYNEGNTGSGTYSLRICEYANFTGSGSLDISKRAVSPHCPCKPVELDYGQVARESIGNVTINRSDYGYIIQGCGRSTKIYN